MRIEAQIARRPRQRQDCPKGVLLGKCHICQGMGPGEFIVALQHWICLGCQERFFDRGLEFVKDLLKGESLDCCGPIASL